MIAKEWRNAKWKFAVATFLFLALIATNLLTYEQVVGGLTATPAQEVDISPKPVEPKFVNYAISEMMFGNYDQGGKPILALLAALLGFSAISVEVSQGTILLLLSRPVSRTRLLLVKYSIGAGILFVVALLGSISLVVSGFAHGYPLSGHLSILGVGLSTVLLWMGSLVVLSLAFLGSIVFRSVISSVVATVLALCLVFNFAGISDVVLYNLQDTFRIYRSPGVPRFLPYGPSETLNVAEHWSSASLYLGETLAIGDFAVCLAAAAVPLLVALWLFKRKAY